jgi:hypothetical protein
MGLRGRRQTLFGRLLVNSGCCMHFFLYFCRGLWHGANASWLDASGEHGLGATGDDRSGWPWRDLRQLCKCSQQQICSCFCASAGILCLLLSAVAFPLCRVACLFCLFCLLKRAKSEGAFVWENESHCARSVCAGTAVLESG